MTTREKLDHVLDQMDEKQQSLLLNIAELQAKGVKILRLINGRPVLTDEEFSKIEGVEGYFQE